jgi:hypothetical protein
MSKTGESILAETMVVPLGADPVEMRKEQEAADEGGCATPGKKKRSKGKGRGLARGDGKGPMGVPSGDDDDDDETSEGKIKRPPEKVSKEDLERIKKLDDEDDEDYMDIPIVALKTFKTFYVEGHTGVAAMMMADTLGIKVGDDMDEEMQNEILLFLEASGPSQLSFLRRSMTKFDAFMNMVKGAWEKLGDSKKEQIVKVLKSKSAKMGTEVKNKASALDPKNADDVMMLATFAYMYGLGLPGDGATAAESDDDTVSE